MAQMNKRRVADTQKLLGAAGGIAVLLAPVLAQSYSSFWDMLKACAVVILGAFLTFLAGLGTRGPGMEYTEVAEAKATAKMLSSLVPPPTLDAPVAPPASLVPPDSPQ